MSNDFYNPSGTPAQASGVDSAPLRSELNAVAAGFNKMPGLVSNNYKIVYVNASGSALDAVGGDGLLKLSTTGVPSIAVPGTDYVADIAATVHAASSKTTPVDADEIGLVDSAAGNLLKKLTWANVKATLKTYLDTLYATVSGFQLTGALLFKSGLNNIASAATLDLTAIGSNSAHVTGTTGISALTMTSGQLIDLIFDGALTLTHHATNNNLPGAANITTAANDRARYWYDGTAVWCVSYIRADGTPVVSSSSSVMRSWLAGLTLSTAGSSATMSIAAGQAADSTNAKMLSIAAFSKTTSAFSAGSGNGGLDTGSIANNTWYHFYLIAKSDGTAADITFSLSASAPTLSGVYAGGLYRRIGSGRTDGAAKWVGFKQTGDYFQLGTSVNDVNTTNPGTSAVSATLGSVPTGVKVKARVNMTVKNVSSSGSVYVSDLDSANEVPLAYNATPGVPGITVSMPSGVGVFDWVATLDVMTNTSAQIRYRLYASGASDVVSIVTYGWIDTRGKEN